MTFDLVSVTHKTFAPYMKSEFSVTTDAGPIVLTLDNIIRHSKNTKRDNHIEIDGVVFPPRRAFALTFEGPREPVLAPRTYKVDHPEVGSFDLFLSGFRQDADCMLYESVFS